MYQIENSRQVLEGHRQVTGGNPAGVGTTVILLGLTSFFTDISAEMVATVLPLYLVRAGSGAAPIRAHDGLYQGGSVLVQVASGFLADRTRKPKRLAVVGYALSAASKLGLLFVQGPMLALSEIVLLDRIGKGIRTAPRDAMISMSSQPGALASAFGVHRALDAAGAMLGPVVAFALLLTLANAFDAVFVVSFCLAMIGLGILALFVDNPVSARREGDAQQRATAIGALALFRERRFRLFVVIGFTLGLTTISDGFLYLALQQQLGLSLSVSRCCTRPRRSCTWSSQSRSAASRTALDALGSSSPATARSGWSMRSTFPKAATVERSGATRRARQARRARCNPGHRFHRH